MMEVIKCDKCGKVIEQGLYCGVNITTFELKSGEHMRDFSGKAIYREVCTDCAKKIELLIDGKVNKGGDKDDTH